mmetsp:Transcript_40066/g.87507  ORF Transcript_40066/g.87507 Transcript_40066/m.87507 type:complete len:157 (-) Transcript_40066:112-582(-)|eukprot:CAMPEP_0170616634 /NCGR_PEP_ID=MMETSP0224-20130122/25973_1 /TAXON_ID=285029 /ORGANISM="Togula jolla, Strain CCCM 725" /LENGTH=156 /DNA_ID=CAMNT_0010942441 /DNA_START=33 /DNA_END=503 /DNA_ORIENTATION=+
MSESWATGAPCYYAPAVHSTPIMWCGQPAVGSETLAPETPRSAPRTPLRRLLEAHRPAATPDAQRSLTASLLVAATPESDDEAWRGGLLQLPTTRWTSPGEPRSWEASPVGRGGGLEDRAKHMSGGGQIPEACVKKARHFFFADLAAATRETIPAA